MKLKTIIINYILPIIFFILFILSISYKVLPTTGSIAYNDSSYYYNIESKDDYRKSVYSDNYFGKDGSSTVFLRQVKTGIINNLKKIGFSDNYISYLITFGLAFLCSLIYYFIFYNISKNRFFGYISGIFVIANNFTIESIAFGGQFYYFLGLISIGLLIDRVYKIYTKNNISSIDILLFTLFSILLILPIHLVMYCLILLIYILTFNRNISGIRSFGIILILIIGLHSYWIVPFLINTITSSGAGIFSGTENGVLDGYSKIANYVNIISFRQYFNNISFRIFPYTIIYVFYISIIISLIYVYIKRNLYSLKEYRFLLLLLSLYFLFFNIALGPNSFITGGVFMYLWENFSVFHFFRSFTRFILPIIPILLLIFSIYTLKNKISNIFLSFLTILLLFFHLPLFSGNLGGTITAITPPKEYSEIANLTNNKNRIISFPNISYETYEWSISTSDIMRQNYYLKENLLLNPVIYDRASLNLHSQNTIFKEIFRAKFNALIDNNIKYVLVHKDYINVFNGLPISFKKYSDYFDTIGVKLLDNEYYNLYELSDVRERIYTDSDNLEFEQISSVKYKIGIKNLEDKETLHFLNNFNSNWKIYDPNGITNIPYSYKNISLLTRDTFFGDSQEVHNKYANKWLIDKNTVINNFSKNSYVNNFDGSIDVDLILFYKPQIYYYIGKIITFLTLLLMSFSLIIHFILKRNAK